MTPVVELLAGALGVCILRVALTVWMPRGAKLPDPSTVPGTPMASAASPQSAHAAINRKKS